MKKGQLLGLPLVLVFALIVAGLILFFGARWVLDLQEQADYVSMLGVIEDIENNVDTEEKKETTTDEEKKDDDKEEEEKKEAAATRTTDEEKKETQLTDEEDPTVITDEDAAALALIEEDIPLTEEEAGEADFAETATEEEFGEEYSEYMADVSAAAPALAPGVIYRDPGDDTGAAVLQGAQVAGQVGSAAKGIQNSFGETAGCFVSNAIPVLGLFQTVDKDLKKGTTADKVSKLVTVGKTYGPKVASLAKQAKTASGIAKFANVATIVAIGYIAFEYGLENETTRVYSIECGMWQPPSGGDNCEECNDKYMPCSEYKCHSLGASCDLVNEGTSNETCVALLVNDVNSPIIEPAPELMSSEYSFTETTEEGNKGFEIQELIPAFTPVQFALQTDEPALCKYSAEPSIEFQDMNSYFGDNIYLYNHTMMFSLSDDAMDEEIVALTEGIHTIYVRCADANGNANERDYFIRFSVDTTPDLTPPEIVYTSVEGGAYMPYGVEELDFAIYTNEPASCRWNNNDTGYDFMSNEMSCPQSGYEQSSQFYGTYECTTTLTGVSEDEINNFYFRCLDQSGNVNEESLEYTTKQTEDELEIVSVSPSGEVKGTEVTIEVETEDGAYDGAAECRFSQDSEDYNTMVTFVNTNSTDHSQSLTLTEGEFTYYVTCQDRAGNRATNSTEFSVSVDTTGPQVVLMYVDTVYSQLYMEMDEESTCEYAVEEFTYGEGTYMTGFNSTEHEANLEELYYNIICEDNFGNAGSYYVDISTWTQ